MERQEGSVSGPESSDTQRPCEDHHVLEEGSYSLCFLTQEVSPTQDLTPALCGSLL